jgi:hypothetical protein
MGLQHNPHFFFAHLPSVVESIEGIGKGLLAFGTKVALTTFTRLSMFMRFVMTTQRTLHNTTQEQLYFVQSISPTLLPCTTRARYIGLAKTHLQHLMTATAINFKRIFYWLSEVPQVTTRTSEFANLMA